MFCDKDLGLQGWARTCLSLTLNYSHPRWGKMWLSSSM